jgi:hypothetical protein
MEARFFNYAQFKPHNTAVYQYAILYITTDASFVTVVARVLLNSVGLLVNFMPFSPDFNQTYIFPTVFNNVSEHKLHENPFQLGPSGCMRAERRADKHNETDSRFFQLCLHT